MDGEDFSYIDLAKQSLQDAMDCPSRSSGQMVCLQVGMLESNIAIAEAILELCEVAKQIKVRM